ncbi:MAG: hypothetical protein HY093_04565 [Candidatus Liptonbacteria bacterium]|nr:hypothetical protein [Candidatus Liptonbacteria bacterium]
MLDLFQTLGLQNLAPNQKDELFAEFTDLFLQKLMGYLYDHLNPADRTEFEKLAEENNEEKINLFLKTKIPNFEALAKSEAEKLIAEIKSRAAS